MLGNNSQIRHLFIRYLLFLQLNTRLLRNLVLQLYLRNKKKTVQITRMFKIMEFILLKVVFFILKLVYFKVA